MKFGSFGSTFVSTTLHVLIYFIALIYVFYFWSSFILVLDHIDPFLSSLKDFKDNTSQQSCDTKSVETQANPNASSEHQNDRQPESNEKIVKLPNGYRTVWKDQSYSYATGKFKPLGLCTRENPGRN